MYCISDEGEGEREGEREGEGTVVSYLQQVMVLMQTAISCMRIHLVLRKFFEYNNYTNIMFCLSLYFYV